ncbi:hypothetical protein FOZ60_003010 [Perkinsus olseni]|uniref:Uncharacterized protein n=1 Tax=Perkinsus olseni TaxID=32597 RepID=A0A7J6NXD7_PEROL|nr:hypothetical protein FOZ60_003010 [Perkinsus olseni]
MLLYEVLATIFSVKNYKIIHDKSGLTRSAAFLLFFTVVHGLGNLHIFAGAPHFNGYGYFLNHPVPWSTLMLPVEVYLLLCGLMHVAVALVRTFKFKRINMGIDSLWMAISGVCLLAFLVVHLMQFRFVSEAAAPQYYFRSKWMYPFYCSSDDTSCQLVHFKDLYRMEFDLFSNPFWVCYYLVGILFFISHAREGLKKVVNSHPVVPRAYKSAACLVGQALVILVGLCYLSFPIYGYFGEPGPPSSLPCTPTNRAKTPSVCGGSDAGINSSLLGRQGSRAEVDRVVHRLHNEHRSRRMASDVPSIASRASKLLSAREASIADHKERIGREEGARHTPVINRRSRSLARTRKDLDTWAEDVRRRKEQRQAQHEAEMKAACTFAPNIYTRRGHKGGEKVEPVGERLLRAAEVSKAKIETKRKAIEAARMQQVRLERATTSGRPTVAARSSSRERAQCASTSGSGENRDVFKRLTSASTGTNGSRPGQGSLRTVKHVSEEGVAPVDGKVVRDQRFGRAETNRWCEGVTATSPSSFPVHSSSPLTISGREQHSSITALGRLRTDDGEDSDSVEDFSPLRRIFQLTASYSDA